MSHLMPIDSSSGNDSQQHDVKRLLSNPDLLLGHFVPFLTFHDAGCCEQVFRFDNENTWKFLCLRDFQLHSKEAPDLSFRTILQDIPTWKQVYQRWHAWHIHTHHVTTTQQGLDAVRLFQDIQSFCTQHQFDASFLPGLDTATLETWAYHPNVPSDLVAWHAVCGGQTVLSSTSTEEDFWAGCLGCYTCYDAGYAMRLHDGRFGLASLQIQPDLNRNILVASCTGNTRLVVSVRKDPLDDPHGRLVRMRPFAQDETNAIIVGDKGILQYLQQYVKHLLTGTFPMAAPSAEEPHARVSACITNGVEVRASARWLPDFSHIDRRQLQEEEGLNFGYSIRIRMVDSSIANTCQLVSRHWEFVDGHGTVRRVDGEAVIGPTGNDETFTNTVFTYQSQTGPVVGTNRQDTHGAHVRGYFRFVPGCIDRPEGPPFNVTVAPFHLTVPFPFTKS